MLEGYTCNDDCPEDASIIELSYDANKKEVNGLL